MNIFKQPILLLYKQYCDSIGKNYSIDNLVIDSNELYTWICRNNKISEMYIDFLKYQSVPIYEHETFELNKTIFDSLLKEEIRIISEYANTFGMKKSTIEVFENKPIIITEDSKIEEVYPSCVLTHNPYSEKDYSALEQLHANNIFICLGMFGKIYDKDYYLKIKILKDFNSEHDGIVIEYEEINDNYFGIVKSNPKIKYLIKAR